MNRRAFLRACRGALLGAAIAFPRISLAVSEGDGWESDDGKEYTYFTVDEVRPEYDGCRYVRGSGESGTVFVSLSPEVAADIEPGDILRLENHGNRWADAE